MPGKNIRPLAGKPLYRHAVDAALAAGAQQVLLCTDMAQLLAASHGPGVRVIERPADLAGDTVPMAPVLAHALQAAQCSGTVVLLQATSPLRQVADIHAALAVWASGQHELVMSVTETDSGVLKWGRAQGERFVPLSQPEHCFANRQSLPEVLRPNGAVYVFDAQAFLARGTLACERMGMVRMSAQSSLDIDTLADFERCQAALALHESP